MSAVLHLCTTVQETRYQTVCLGHKQCLKILGVLVFKDRKDWKWSLREVKSVVQGGIS